MTSNSSDSRFICDRMAGSLCRFLRLMGYDTLSANDLPPGDRKEDTHLLHMARRENRILLTRDAELVSRDTTVAIYLISQEYSEQIHQLISADLIEPTLRLTRCSLCNTLLQHPDDGDLTSGTIAIPEYCPKDDGLLWCNTCKKMYWEGSHTRKMQEQITRIAELQNHRR